MLAHLLPNDKGEVASVPITGVNPGVFRNLLWYVYEGTVVEDILKANAKDIINAADKYGVVSLKLEAEVAYVESTKITVDNAMDNLLYADAKNCALLKEAAIDFLTDNGREVISKVSFADFPGHIVKDLLVATTRKEDKTRAADDFDIMRVSELRRMLVEKGLDVDGSREAMIEALRSIFRTPEE